MDRSIWIVGMVLSLAPGQGRAVRDGDAPEYHGVLFERDPRALEPFGWQAPNAPHPTAAVDDSAPDGDIDGDGWVGATDYAALCDCLAGPGHPPDPDMPLTAQRCLDAFDHDGDGDVDLADFARFQTLPGHVPFPLRNYRGNVIHLGSNEPYSGRHTCGTGGCHDIDTITNGFLFQQGRTGLDGNVILGDDFWGDGRHWIKGPGRYGTWGQSFIRLLAGKHFGSASRIDQGAWDWVKTCSGCHVGAGPGERDRDGILFFDEAADLLGWEFLGTDPTLDGDYADLNVATGDLRVAPWEVTGTSGPDCLYCHRRDRVTVSGSDMMFGWRRGVLGAGEALVDDTGQSVPAFQAAGNAGQGWFSHINLGASPPVLEVGYCDAVQNGVLELAGDGAILLPKRYMVRPPRDRACVPCHVMSTVWGATWFDERDVMYAGLNNLRDDDPSNDIPPDQSHTCNTCHPGDIHHNFAKGNSLQIQWRNETDFQALRSCRSCHMVDSPDLYPGAPVVPGDVTVHLAGDEDNGPMVNMSCQACHIPYALLPAVIFRDITVGGAVGMTSQYYSADPLNPADPDKSRWYPAMEWKIDHDGRRRLFPANTWINIYWGDWNRSGTPEDLSDDIIEPLMMWRVNQVIDPDPLPVVTDDNGDGAPEINSPEEMLAYFAKLKLPDSHGQPVAANPVMVKGIYVWYEDPDSPTGVGSFDHRGTGIPITSYPYRWGLDHNALAASESWGRIAPGHQGCNDCHFAQFTGGSVVFERKILVDPYGLDGQPEYRTVRELTGADPP